VTQPPVKAKPPGLDRPSTTTIIKLMSTLHSWVYARTGGRVGKNWRIGAGLRKAVPVCLLTTTGAKSGRPRTVPLCFLKDDRDIVLVASQGGLPTNPQWYGNLVKDPSVEIRIGRSVQHMRARTADSDERAVLWPKLLELYADFASYQTWTEREIPLVICSPT
jgi:deazaflavin-dependent oxidoreductase (nitroreductase family)